jgi:hypothetical protein
VAFPLDDWQERSNDIQSSEEVRIHVVHNRIERSGTDAAEGDHATDDRPGLSTPARLNRDTGAGVIYSRPSTGRSGMTGRLNPRPGINRPIGDMMPIDTVRTAI